MDRHIMENYSQAHNRDPPPLIKTRINLSWTNRLSDDEIRSVCLKIPRNKAISFDCVVDELFDLKCDCLNYPTRCKKCTNRMKLIRVFLTNGYWSEDNVKFHFRSRLVSINKVAPNRAQVTDLRPIVIQSPILKLLELLITNKLNNYHTKRMRV